MRRVSGMKKNTSKWWDAFLYVCHFSQCDVVLWVTAEESTDSVSRLTETCIRYTPASQMWHSMHLKSFLWKEKTTSMGSSQTSIHLLSFKWTDQPDGIKQSRDWGCSLTYRSFLTKTVSLEEFNWRCSENLPWLFHVLLSQLSPPHLLFLSPFLLPLIFFLFLAASSLLCLPHMCVAPSLILPPSLPSYLLLSSGPWQHLLITSCWMNMLPAHLRTISVVSTQKSTQSSSTPLQKVFWMRQLLERRLEQGQDVKPQRGRGGEGGRGGGRQDGRRKRQRGKWEKGSGTLTEEGRRVREYRRRQRRQVKWKLSWFHEYFPNNRGNQIFMAQVEAGCLLSLPSLPLSPCNQLPDSFYLHKHTSAVITAISSLYRDHILIHLWLLTTPASHQHLCAVTLTPRLKSSAARAMMACSR